MPPALAQQRRMPQLCSCHQATMAPGSVLQALSGGCQGMQSVALLQELPWSGSLFNGRQQRCHGCRSCLPPHRLAFLPAGIFAMPAGSVSEVDGDLAVEAGNASVPYAAALSACRSALSSALVPAGSDASVYENVDNPINLYVPR